MDANEPASNSANSPRPSRIPSWLYAWWPALLWGAFISILSTDSFSSEHTSRIIIPILRWLIPSISPEMLGIVHHLIRKSAHFTEYFIFCLLLYHGVRASRRNKREWRWSYALVAWLIAAVYSVLDEVHQIFVPSRGPSPWDSLIDSTGALFALLVLFLLYRRLVRPTRAE